MLKSFLISLAILLPQVTQAALLINEIAWMGSLSSANDEWIEIYNSGSEPVSVDDWTLSDGADFNVLLEGIINPGVYALLERTDDSSAVGAAFFIYTGALVNSGATLTLRDELGAIKDQVAGGENWSLIGGDNVSKNTAQLSSAGWLTGLPTPGSTNASEDLGTESDSSSDQSDETEDEDIAESTNSSSVSVSSKSSKQKAALILPDHTLTLTLTAPTRTYVNQPVVFTLEPSGIGNSFLKSLAYEWNFGDLHTSNGKSVTHNFAYPGKYIVFVTANYARHQAVLRHEITVLPVNFSLTLSSQGELQINNDAKYEVDLSGYKITGEQDYILPNNTIMLPGATLTVPRKNVKIDDRSHVKLFDRSDLIVANLESKRTVTVESGAVPPTQRLPSSLPIANDVSKIKVTDPFKFKTEAKTTTLIPLDSEPVSSTTNNLLTQSSNQAAVASSTLVSGIAKSAYPYLALVGLLTITFLVILSSRRNIVSEV